MGAIKKPVWWGGKIYPSTTQLSKEIGVSVYSVYQRLSDGTPLKGHCVDYVLTFDEMQLLNKRK